ncbi:tRNA (adenosine(37)-N6)-dimethylallyltransferase MiaA [Arcanobacterium hippocoleae]|uniref:tRNA dimethylallyltransferase n=1 Tax=Arcanobacterium hippocoleae TaxID=149017 RepID=A0ABU1T0X4_9ACTO|nr:tRNA (adenosine(37)-N6)-dimethylallyltransferase MiaA [Arcanobacterium hippocoleae]MDR6939023.1 tRNA dimethylallyltransferase [Arcanobacterium hippocoleae]
MLPHNFAQPIYCIVGPTASGKTALSIALAKALGGVEQAEIISADAMQLYRGMDIGTAKITASEMCGIRHHQLDVLNVRDEASVAKYQESARADLAQIVQNGKIPIIVGGSGLYVSALLDELEFPGTDENIRKELNEIWESFGLDPLISELREKDPVSAAKINLANPRRVIRALEVVRLTGKSYTPVFPRHTAHYSNVVQIGVRVEKEILHERILHRTEKMFATGLLTETENLLSQGLREASTASKATGYAQSIAVIDNEISIDEAIANTAFATRRLAKKQRTWFGADPRINWFDFSNKERSAHENAIRYAIEQILAKV